MKIKDIYDSTYFNLFSYFAINSANLEECRDLLIVTYRRFIVKYGEKKVLKYRPLLMSIAEEELRKYRGEDVNDSTAGVDVYIQRGQSYLANEISQVKDEVYSQIKDIQQGDNKYYDYFRRRIIAFITLFIYVCLRVNFYSDRVEIRHETYYECYEMQLVGDKLYFSDGKLKYVDISKSSGKSNVVSENQIERFHVFNDSVIYSNSDGIFVSKLTGSEEKMLINFSTERPFNSNKLSGSAFFHFYGDKIYFSNCFIYRKTLKRAIYCYDIYNGELTMVYNGTGAYDPGKIVNYRWQIIGLDEAYIYFLEINNSILIPPPNTEVTDTVRAVSLDLKIGNNLFKISRAYIYEPQIKYADGFFYAVRTNTERDEKGRAFSYGQLIKYNSRGEVTDRSEVKIKNASNLSLSDAGELYFKIAGRGQISRINFDSSKAENVYNLDYIFRNSYIYTFAVEDLLCFTARYDNKCKLFIIKPDGKKLVYDIVI